MSTFYATTITLATTATALGDYVTGTASGAGHTSSGLVNARQIDFLADSANTGNVVVGDLAVTSTDYGKTLAASGTYEINKVLVNDRINMGDIFLIGSAAGQKVHVSIVL